MFCWTVNLNLAWTYYFTGILIASSARPIIYLALYVLGCRPIIGPVCLYCLLPISDNSLERLKCTMSTLFCRLSPSRCPSPGPAPLLPGSSLVCWAGAGLGWPPGSPWPPPIRGGCQPAHSSGERVLCSAHSAGEGVLFINSRMCVFVRKPHVSHKIVSHTGVRTNIR